MRLGHLELFCTDCFSTQAFYNDILNWETVDVQGGRFVWLRSEDGFEILLRPGKKFAQPETYHQSPNAIVVYVDDLESFTDRLNRARVTSKAIPNEPDCIAFQDPDGRWIQAVEKY